MVREQGPAARDVEEVLDYLTREARALAAATIRMHPDASAFEVSALFAREWFEYAESAGTDLIHGGLMVQFEALYPRVCRIADVVLAELDGLTNAGLKRYAEQWCRPAER